MSPGECCFRRTSFRATTSRSLISRHACVPLHRFLPIDLSECRVRARLHFDAERRDASYCDHIDRAMPSINLVIRRNAQLYIYLIATQQDTVDLQEKSIRSMQSMYQMRLSARRKSEHVCVHSPRQQRLLARLKYTYRLLSRNCSRLIDLYPSHA